MTHPIDLTRFEGATPGPWIPDELCIVGADGKAVAQTYRDYDFFGEDSLPVGEIARIEANSRLVCAAPDLLAEVIRLRALVKRTGAFVNHVARHSHSKDEGEDGDPWEARDALDLIIAKARDEQTAELRQILRAALTGDPT
jgi:hypothetical protein